MGNMLEDLWRDAREKFRINMLGLRPTSPITGEEVDAPTREPFMGPVGTSRMELVRNPRPTKSMEQLFRERFPSPFDSMANPLNFYSPMATLGGGKAMLANLTNRALASRKLKEGENALQVFRETGYWRDPKGHLVFEIPDNNMLLKTSQDGLLLESPKSSNIRLNFIDPYNAKRKGISPVKLDDIVQHDDLFGNYPQLRTVEIGMDTRGARGNWDYLNNRINIADRIWKPWELKDVLLHELSHVTQSIEARPNGTAPAAFLPKGYQKKIDAIDEGKSLILNELIRKQRMEPAEASLVWENLHHAILDNGLMTDDMFEKLGKLSVQQPETFQKLYNLAKENVSHIQEYNKAVDKYELTAGEMEARNVVGRSNATPESLKQMPFWETYDLPVNKMLDGPILPWFGDK